MSLKSIGDLFFYEENCGAASRGFGPIFYGLYASKGFLARQAWEKRGLISKMILPGSQPVLDPYSDVDFVAAAYVERFRNGVAVLKNIAASGGYGPTMYACLIQMISDDGPGFFYPSQVKGEIVDASIKIWRRFHDNCDLIDIKHEGADGPHSEPWLNCGYRVKSEPLIDLAPARARYKTYVSLIPPRAEGTIRDLAFDFCQASVRAYKK